MITSAEVAAMIADVNRYERRAARAKAEAEYDEIVATIRECSSSPERELFESNEDDDESNEDDDECDEWMATEEDDYCIAGVDDDNNDEADDSSYDEVDALRRYFANTRKKRLISMLPEPDYDEEEFLDDEN